MTLEEYLDKKLLYYLEDIEAIGNPKDKLDILIKAKQIRVLEDIEGQLRCIGSVMEDIAMALQDK